MRTAVWYHIADRQPEKSGYYMGYMTMTLADDTTGVNYFYWNKEEGQWRTDSTCYSRWANVYYWTKDDPEKWVDSDPPLSKRGKIKDNNPALAIAWKRVEEAVQQYELLKTLVGKHETP